MEKRKIQWTPMLKQYMGKLGIRVLIFAAVLILYLWDREGLYRMVSEPMGWGISLLHVLWLIFMVMMIRHLFPSGRPTMALLKSKEQPYEEAPGYSELEMRRFVQDQNVKAWWVMLTWLSANAVFGVLYLFHIMDEVDLLMLTVFYFLMDYVCILFFCPFQTFLMKNKCCVNCRIYDWGHFMMFMPMLFIRNFFSWSLFFTSCVVLIHWEILYAKHPERFWSGSNRSLQCAHCQDKTCQIKRKLAGKPIPSPENGGNAEK